MVRTVRPSPVETARTTFPGLAQDRPLPGLVSGSAIELRSEHVRLNGLSPPAPMSKPGSARRLLETDQITGEYVHQVAVLLTLELIHNTLLRAAPRTTQVDIRSDSLVGTWHS